MPSGEGKSDMERLGVFKEMSYISVGDKYTSPSNRPFNESAYRSRQIQAGIAGLQSVFFEKSYKRIFEREALSDPLRLARQNRIQQAKKNLGKAFVPYNGVKKPYPNVTLSRFELYASDPYDKAKDVLKREAAIHRSKLRDGPFKLNLHPRDYFQGNPYHSNKPLLPAQKPLPPAQNISPVPFKPPSPGKRIGGIKAGTFNTYPSHSADPVIIRRSKDTNHEPIFRPARGPKSTPVKSIITMNVNRTVHSANYISSFPPMMTL
ncbi:cilia-and flagella-associated protein 96 isoform X2 [Platichthys flesus]|uniref:cilia-and flagella-associated protein 96 isoform X2 n=1 Tax=Platichthys flesus TaxID=8260 RepID=UPI002DBF7F75|nr:cilia-and flagella-associated protein 96 isoform X2 [Platichthys flesus]